MMCINCYCQCNRLIWLCWCDCYMIIRLLLIIEDKMFHWIVAYYLVILNAIWFLVWIALVFVFKLPYCTLCFFCVIICWCSWYWVIVTECTCFTLIYSQEQFMCCIYMCMHDIKGCASSKCTNLWKLNESRCQLKAE